MPHRRSQAIRVRHPPSGRDPLSGCAPLQGRVGGSARAAALRREAAAVEAAAATSRTGAPTGARGRAVTAGARWRKQSGELCGIGPKRSIKKAR